MTNLKRDEVRERRIIEEIVVDAYGAEERAMSWYYHLEDQLRFPFTATCIARRSISPLRVNDEVDVIRMPAEDHQRVVDSATGSSQRFYQQSANQPRERGMNLSTAAANWAP